MTARTSRLLGWRQPQPSVCDHVGDDLLERALRPKPGPLLDLAAVRHAPLHILEPLGVRLLVGNELDWRSAICSPTHKLRKIAHAYLAVGAEHRDRLARQSLVGEIRKHHSIPAGLSRSDRVEEAGDRHWEAVLAPMCQTEPLVHRLRARISPSRVCGRAKR